MRTHRTLAGFAAAACLVFLVAGCTSEQLSLTLQVSATPNPAVGVADADGRRWDYQVSIGNPNSVGVVVEYYHAEITGTDTGYSQPLQVVRDSPLVIGQRIEAGATLAYSANRSSHGEFTRGRERRIYHARSDDGAYFSGEVAIDLQ